MRSLFVLDVPVRPEGIPGRHTLGASIAWKEAHYFTRTKGASSEIPIFPHDYPRS